MFDLVLRKPLTLLAEDKVRTRTDNFVLRTRKISERTKSVIETLRVDPDGGVLDLQAGSGAGAFVVARQHRLAFAQNLAGIGIDLGFRPEAHVFDDEIAEAGAHYGHAEGAAITQELDLPLRRQHADPVADRVLAAQTCLVLEGLTELRGGVETHLYLGRQYRLKVIPHVQESVKLVRGFIVVHTHRPNRAEVTRDLVEGWYRDRAHMKFPERIAICLELFPNPEAFRPKGLIVRQTRQRWGSMSPAGRLLLNRRLVQAPVDAIDYVITHELCHLAEPHHGAAFFELLHKVMPDWERRKQRLERAMA